MTNIEIVIHKFSNNLYNFTPLLKHFIYMFDKS